MNYEFLLPLIGAGVAAAWTYGKSVPESKTEKLTFVEDEVPLTGIKDDGVVLTQTGQVFKVVALSGQSVAGKRADDLEKAASARALFFRRVSESKVHLRIISQKTLTPVSKKPPCGRPSLLIVDEAPTLLSSQPLKSEIEKLLKTARKQRMAIFMAFQGTNDLKTLNIKETILTNCHTRFFYDGCAGTPEEIDGFNLTESETDFVLTKGAKIEGAKRPVLMQRNGVNVFLETDMSCLGNYLNAFKGGAKAVRFLDYAKLFKPEDPAAYYLKHYGANR